MSGYADFSPQAPAAGAWRILVVDDDPEVHAVTRLALGEFSFEGRTLEILSAHSAAQARELWQRERGIALALVDVVMETDQAGLELVRFIRDEQGDDNVRIVLRTGQPGQAPALEVIQQYEIDDYRTKTELTFQRLHVVVTTALRTYRLLQEMERRRAALEQSSREMERFAYVTSHDLQSPLRTIAGFSHLLDLHYRSALDVKARELLDRVADSARAMEALIGDLLEYARVRRNVEAIGKVNLNQVIEATRRSTQMLIDQRQAVLDYGVLPQLEGDAALLEQLFAALIDNAIRFQPQERPQVLIEAADLGHAWEIRVIDHGPGIDPADQQAVFEPFRRARRGPRHPAAGIGLAVCKRIAEVHGGGIAIRSTPGQGTTMAVTLPKQQHHHGAGAA
jgi:signal transduction histidine kinase